MDSSPFHAPLKKGLLNIPGSSPKSVELLRDLLRKDYEEHHCFWSDSGLHNHLAHHLLAAHDLGSPPSLLSAIFDNEFGMQQPLRKEGSDGSAENLTVATWTSHLGKSEAYADYLAFFSSEIATVGVPETLKRYVFAPSANRNGALMLVRVVSGLMHPFIQLGYGVEFGQDFMVAEGLARSAVTPPGGVPVFEMPAGMPSLENSKTPSPSLLSLLREVYYSPLLVPATLLFAGTGKQGRKPRLDFFLMHYLTGAISLSNVLKVLDTTLAKAQLLHGLRVMEREPHVAAARTLYYTAQLYGHTPTGAFPEMFNEDRGETHAGAATLDGTVFIRATRVIAGEEGVDWDRSGLGWEEAWAGDG
ncbi:hypothetical protein K438DRAFT_1919499 [Mycena galopus ATCC 62051]|nr:hypothetical protein K438DRAFT_1919499 [Mycena galopus ATCC 62051]